MVVLPLPVMRYPMRLWVGEQLLRRGTAARNPPCAERGADASHQVELPLPAGSASGPATQTSTAWPSGPLGAGVLTCAREGAEGGKGSENMLLVNWFASTCRGSLGTGAYPEVGYGKIKKGQGKMGTHRHTTPLIDTRPGPSVGHWDKRGVPNSASRGRSRWGRGRE